jgi:TRAP-type C4-dicarboxylate transport system permease small subunit
LSANVSKRARDDGQWSDLLKDYVSRPLGPVERVCQFVCEVGMIAMAVIVLIEIVTRNVFNFSFQISDEVGGYIVVGLTFLALPVCQVRRAYHHVMFVQARLSPRIRAASHLLFDLLCLGFCLILVWQLTAQVIGTYQSGDVAPTELATPLWIPQLVMPIGSVALTLAVLRDTWRNARRLLALGARFE